MRPCWRQGHSSDSSRGQPSVDMLPDSASQSSNMRRHRPSKPTVPKPTVPHSPPADGGAGRSGGGWRRRRDGTNRGLAAAVVAVRTSQSRTSSSTSGTSHRGGRCAQCRLVRCSVADPGWVPFRRRALAWVSCVRVRALPGKKSEGGLARTNVAGLDVTELGSGRALVQAALFDMAEPEFVVPSGPGGVWEGCRIRCGTAPHFQMLQGRRAGSARDSDMPRRFIEERRLHHFSSKSQLCEAGVGFAELESG